MAGSGGPKGQVVSIGLWLRGHFLCNLSRYATNKRTMFEQVLLDICGKGLQIETQHKPCSGLFAVESKVDAEAFIDSGREGDELARLAEEEASPMVQEKLEALHGTLKEAVEQIPTKLICMTCQEKVELESTRSAYYCHNCKEFRHEAQLGYAGPLGNVLFSPEQVEQQTKLRMLRGINLIGMVHPSEIIDFWRTDETFGVLPSTGNKRFIDNLRGRLHHRGEPMFGYYCSANEHKQISLRYEHAALFYADGDQGENLMITTLRPKRDLQVRGRDPMPRKPGLVGEAIDEMLDAVRVTAADMRTFLYDSPARVMTLATIDGHVYNPAPFDAPADEGLIELCKKALLFAAIEGEAADFIAKEHAKKETQAEPDSTPDETDEEEPLEEETEVSQSEEEG